MSVGQPKSKELAANNKLMKGKQNTSEQGAESPLEKGQGKEKDKDCIIM